MKIEDILNESNNNIIEELKSSKYDDYRLAIDRLLNNDWYLIRGSDHYPSDKITINKPRSNRKPAFADTLFYFYAFKNLNPWKNLPERSVICGTMFSFASDYGNVFYIVPKNDTVLCELPAVDLWWSFDETPLVGYSDGTNSLQKISAILEDFIESITKEEINEKNFINLLDKADAKIKYNIDNGIDFDEVLQKNENYTHLLKNRNFKENILKYFNIDIKQHSVKNFNINGDKEVWFSNEYLTIPYRPIEKYLAINFQD